MSRYKAGDVIRHHTYINGEDYMYSVIFEVTNDDYVLNDLYVVQKSADTFSSSCWVIERDNLPYTTSMRVDE